MYRFLQSEKVVATAAVLRERVHERFPESGLSKVAGEVHDLAREAMVRSAKIRRRNFPLRFIALLLAAGVVGFIVWVVLALPEFSVFKDQKDLAAFCADSISSVVFVGAVILTLLTLEIRLKRRRALTAIHELRAVAHVIDMHQLTKDPDRVLNSGQSTATSPKRTMSPFELGRYLDYCSELLSLVSKIAALYVQGFPDQVAVDAVDQVESLTVGLSRKIWQKITLLHQLYGAKEMGAA